MWQKIIKRILIVTLALGIGYAINEIDETREVAKNTFENYWPVGH